MFSLTPELRLRTCCETPMAVQNMLRLVLDGKLHIDWWEPLGLDSRICSHQLVVRYGHFRQRSFRRPDVAACIEDGASSEDWRSRFLDCATAPRRCLAVQNTVTGEWRTFDENDLLDQFATNDLSFIVAVNEAISSTSKYLKSSLETFLSILQNWSIWPRAASST